jgi:hypothetical protein
VVAVNNGVAVVVGAPAGGAAAVALLCSMSRVVCLNFKVSRAGYWTVVAVLLVNNHCSPRNDVWGPSKAVKYT